jgi:hypothetical protein
MEINKKSFAFIFGFIKILDMNAKFKLSDFIKYNSEKEMKQLYLILFLSMILFFSGIVSGFIMMINGHGVIYGIASLFLITMTLFMASMIVNNKIRAIEKETTCV